MPSLLQKTIQLNQQQEKLSETAFPRARALLKNAKKAISRLHFNDRPGAEQLLGQCQKEIKALQKLFQQSPRLKYEGFVKEGLEEYIEARLFFNYANNAKIELDQSLVELVKDSPQLLVGGLCDFTGELTRKVIRMAKPENAETVKQESTVINKIIDHLLELNLHGLSRNKFDQAKRNAQKIESILYDLRLR